MQEEDLGGERAVPLRRSHSPRGKVEALDEPL